ncbi:MAG: 30S ribosomal protein S6 [Deltaproteobacteria bacterium]|jgi:small subunit ribosomal protein S6
MRYYETIFILNPNLSEEDCREVLNKFTGMVEKQKGVLVRVEEWGNQKLAYVVKKFEKGFFVLMNYCGMPGLVAEIEREMKLDDRVLKCQTVKLADKVDPQELILKEKEAKEKAAVQEDQVAEGAETGRREEQEESVGEVSTDG